MRIKNAVRPSLRAGLFLIVLLTAGCGERDAGTSEATAAPKAPPSPGLYEGTFPCADCPGIEVTLWLRPDGAFFLRQHYLADGGNGGEAERYYALGRWDWDAADAELRLQGAGPVRVFDRPEPGVLAMRVASDLPHRLVRGSDLVPFTDTLTLEGEYQEASGERRFRECLSGLSWSIAPGGDYRRLLHQYGRVPRGEHALARVRGHLKPTEGGTRLVVEELIQLQPGRRCP